MRADRLCPRAGPRAARTRRSPGAVRRPAEGRCAAGACPRPPRPRPPGKGRVVEARSAGASTPREDAQVGGIDRAQGRFPDRRPPSLRGGSGGRSRTPPPGWPGCSCGSASTWQVWTRPGGSEEIVDPAHGGVLVVRGVNGPVAGGRDHHQGTGRGAGGDLDVVQSDAQVGLVLADAPAPACDPRSCSPGRTRPPGRSTAVSRKVWVPAAGSAGDADAALVDVVEGAQEVDDAQAVPSVAGRAGPRPTARPEGRRVWRCSNWGRVVVAHHVPGEGHAAEAGQADGAAGYRAQWLVVQPARPPVSVGQAIPAPGRFDLAAGRGSRRRRGRAGSRSGPSRPSSPSFDPAEDPGPEGRTPGQRLEAGHGQDALPDLPGPPPPGGQVRRRRQGAGSRQRPGREQAPVAGAGIASRRWSGGGSRHAAASTALIMA